MGCRWIVDTGDGYGSRRAMLRRSCAWRFVASWLTARQWTALFLEMTRLERVDLDRRRRRCAGM